MMKPQSLFQYVIRLLGLFLILTLWQCHRNVDLWNEKSDPCTLKVPVKKHRSDFFNAFHAKKYQLVEAICNDLILDPQHPNYPFWVNRLQAANFKKVDSCNCLLKAELWTYQGSGVIDLQGVVKDPPPSSDGVGGIAFNYLVDNNPNWVNVDQIKGEEIQQSGLLKDSQAKQAAPCSLQPIKVAIIDAGVDTNPGSLLYDLGWQRSALRPGACRNFPSSLVYGYNLMDPTREPSDLNGHGISVNSVAAGIPTNTNGFDYRLPLEFMNVKFTEGTTQRGSLFKAICGAYHAIDNGAKVLNLSWGYPTANGKERFSLLNTLMEKARDSNVVIVAALGNDSLTLNGQNRFWPACLAEFYDNVIAVGAVDAANQRAPFSNWARGPRMTIAAYGVGVKSITRGSMVVEQSGTSLAAPLVTRAVAAMLAANPSLTPAQVKQKLLDHSRTMPGGYRVLDYKKTLVNACSGSN